MAATMKGSSKSMKSVVSATTTGLTARLMQANGRRTRWTVKARSNGKTERAIQVTLSTIKEREKAPSCGLMAASTLEDGRQESSMDSATTSLKKEWQGKESGTTDARLDG